MKTIILAFLFLTSSLTAAQRPYELPSGSHYNYCPANHHMLLGYAIDSLPGISSIELEDRSVWNCSESYNHILQGWQQSDTLKVIYNSCNSQPFTIKNMRTKDSIVAHMEESPGVHSPYTYFVNEIKGDRLTLIMRSKVTTTYAIYSDDCDQLDELKRGHAVFIAENHEQCTKDSHPYVLFAWTKEGTYLKAKKIN